MHEHHDEGLILDLLEASVTEAEATSRLDGCDQCLADFIEQRSISGYLEGLDSFTISGPERAELRMAVFSELDTGGTIVPLRTGRRLDWTRLGTVAAALVGVVAVAGLFSVIGNGGDDAAETFDQAITAESAENDGGDGAIAAAELPSTDDEAVAGDLGMEESASDAIAAPSDLVIDLGAVDRPSFAEELQRVRELVGERTESSPVLQRDADEVSPQCLVALPVDPGAVRAIVTAFVDGFEVEVYFDRSGGEFGYASIDCSEYELP